MAREGSRTGQPGRHVQVTFAQFLESPRICSYLPDETASLQYRFAENLPVEIFAELLRRGWRRMGSSLFRPQCPACRQCRSLRIPVADFRPSKSQRRSLNRNADIEVRLAPAGVSEEHISLYNAYHADMELRRGWRAQSTSPEEYDSGFLSGGCSFAYEMQYRRDGRLVGLGLIDITPIGLSSIYFFHEPELRSRALGVFSLMCEIDLCRRLGLEHLYLGYWISRCPSMNYKADYRPHELLDAYVGDAEEPRWTLEPSSPKAPGRSPGDAE